MTKRLIHCKSHVTCCALQCTKSLTVDIHPLNPFATVTAVSQALVHLLSEADSGLMLVDAEKKAVADVIRGAKIGEADREDPGSHLKLIIPKSGVQEVVTDEVQVNAEDKEQGVESAVDEPEEALMRERPVIHFNSPQSYLQLSPQRDVQVSWTVEFWIKREEPSVPYAESVQPETAPRKGYADALINGGTSSAGLDKWPLRGLLGLGTRPCNSTPASMDKIQSSISKLSQMLGSDFGVIGSAQSVWGWGESEGEQQGGEAALGAGVGTYEESDSSDDAEGEKEVDAEAEAAQRREDRDQDRGDSSWTMIPPTAGILDPSCRDIPAHVDSSAAVESDMSGLAELQSLLASSAGQEHAGDTSSQGGTVQDFLGSLSVPVPLPVSAPVAAQEQSAPSMHSGVEGVKESSFFDPGPVPSPSGLSKDKGVDPPSDSTQSKQHSASATTTTTSTGTAGTTTPANTNTAATSSGSNSGKKFLVPLIPLADKAKRAEGKEAVPEVKQEVTESILPPIYLLSSTGGHIKLQMGGRVFSGDDFNDPNQEAHPVHNQAYCLSMGQRGSSERAFDYVVPTGCWVHIAISCSVGSNSSGAGTVVSLYADGDLKDSQSMRCNLPIGTVGCNKKGQSFNGYMSNMRVWSCARTAAEIKRDIRTDVTGTAIHAACTPLYFSVNSIFYFDAHPFTSYSLLI